MNRIKRCVAIAVFTVAGLGGAGLAQAQYVGPIGNPVNQLYSNYRDAIEKMNAEDKGKLMAMSDKMMQADMDYKMQMAKMQAQHEMDMTKMHRDMELWLIQYRMGH